MKKYLLPESGNWYKANLHSHSTDSDGGLTPSELVNGYKDRGYSVLAISDHNVFIDRTDLCTDGFLVLNSYEYSPQKFETVGRLTHIGLIAKTQDIKTAPRLPEFRSDEISDDEYTAKVNETVKLASDAGFLPIYNHMRWSFETDNNLFDMNGFFAMELYNGFSEILGVEDTNIAPFLEMHRRGKNIFGVMADDNHNKHGWATIGVENLDTWDTSFIGWIVIKAPDLSYDSIISALERGDFYSSNGPEIYEMYINEQNKLVVKCSEAKSIALGCEMRRGPVRYSRHGTYTEAEFDLSFVNEFVQVTVTDHHGRKAVSQAYRLK